MAVFFKKPLLKSEHTIDIFDHKSLVHYSGYLFKMIVLSNVFGKNPCLGNLRLNQHQSKSYPIPPGDVNVINNNEVTIQ